MLLAGDEIGHSQQGNNNAYCQDNETSWLDWDLKEGKAGLLAFVGRMIALRKRHPVFRRKNFFQGRPIKGVEAKDISWLTPDGREMTDEEWKESSARCLGMLLVGQLILEQGERGDPVTDDNLLVLMNAHHEQIPFGLPSLAVGTGWRATVDTTWTVPSRRVIHAAGTNYPLQARSLVVLIEHREASERRVEQ
jgi:glycogen operon protein